MTTDTTPAAIEALLRGVTPGPWTGFNMVHADHGGAMTPEEIGEYVCNSVKIGAAGKFLFLGGKHDDGGDADIAHFGNGPRSAANMAFVAAARDLVPALAAERDAAIRERDNALALNTALAEANEGLGSAAYLATSRAEKAEAEAAAWRIAVMKLTPGGSEYTNPDAVIAFVERERADRHKARAEKAKAVREAAALRGEVARLKEALAPFADIGIGSDPDYQPTIRMDRAAIIAARAAIEAHRASTPRPINWRDDPEAFVEDDEPMIWRDYE